MLVRDSHSTRRRQLKVSIDEPCHRDGEIARVVVSTLMQNAMVPDGTVWVAVRDAWVTLRGHVEWDGQRAAAGVLTRCVPGVRGVTNALEVLRNRMASPA